MKTSSHAPALFVLALVLAAVAVISAGAPPQGQTPGGSPSAAIEFRALAADGSPVLDLKASDVTLMVDGRAREIRALDLLQTKPVPGGGARGVMPAPFATNALVPGHRDSMLIVDDESLQGGDETQVKAAVEQYLNSLGAGDRVGILTPSGNINLGLSDQLGGVRAAVAKLVGQGRAGESVEDAACRTRRVLNTLTTVAGSFPPSGSTVTVLLFSTGMTPAGTAAMSKVGNASSATGSSCEVQPRDYQGMQTAVLASAVNIYTIAASLPVSNTMQDGIEHLARMTGNRLVQPLKGGDPGLPGLIREHAARYRITFDPEAADSNGAAHRVDLQVKRTGVSASTRPTLLIPKAGAPSAAGKARTAPDMLREATAYRDVEIRASAFASRESGTEKIKLVVLFEPVDPAVTLASAAVGLYDAKGKLVVQGPAEAANLARKPPMVAVLAPPGTYRVRVAATDASGRGGTVDSTTTVSLAPADKLKMSSLVLGVAEAGSFAGRLTFTSEPMAVAYLEVYGVGKTAEVTAQVELAESEDGPALTQGATKILGDGSDDRRVVLGGVPIGPLPPGDILVRMVVSLDGKPIGRVVRTLRKAEK